MKIYVVGLGSRGDNEPFRALAFEAASLGHEVYFAHTTDISQDIGVPFTEWELPGSFEDLISEQGTSVVKALRNYESAVKPLLEGIYEESTKQIRELEPDVVVYHPKVVTAATAAHSVGAIAAIAETFPTLIRTREFAAAGITWPLPGFLNRASYGLVRAGMKAAAKPALRLAEELDVVRIAPDLSLCAVSPTLVPEPTDWPDYATMTGHWSLVRAVPPDEELQEFLTGTPVLYAGFGSMRDDHGKQRAETIVRAARLLGFKTLLVTGWGGLEPGAELSAADDVMVRGTVDHHNVLPRVAVAIHHGGAGTVHRMVASGLSSVIMPFLADQPWWAARLHALGLGPKALSKSTTSPEAIKKALIEAMEKAPAVREAAKSMALEDGAGTAVRILEDAEAGQGPLAP